MGTRTHSLSGIWRTFFLKNVRRSADERTAREGGTRRSSAVMMNAVSGSGVPAAAHDADSKRRRRDGHDAEVFTLKVCTM